MKSMETVKTDSSKVRRGGFFGGERGKKRCSTSDQRDSSYTLLPRSQDDTERRCENKRESGVRTQQTKGVDTRSTSTVSVGRVLNKRGENKGRWGVKSVGSASARAVEYAAMLIVTNVLWILPNQTAEQREMRESKPPSQKTMGRSDEDAKKLPNKTLSNVDKCIFPHVLLIERVPR